MRDLFVIASPENAEDSSLECCNSFSVVARIDGEKNYLSEIV